MYANYNYKDEQDAYSQLKKRLTRVVNQGDPFKIMDEVVHAKLIFAEHRAFPDYWMRWENAYEDARYQIHRKQMNY
jgi:hypothetical protein